MLEEVTTMGWVLTVVLVLILVLSVLALTFLLGMRTKFPPVLRAVRRMNRLITNPRQMRSAGTPGSFAGVIHHTGRTSGREYETPVGPFPTDDGFVITLPYGTGTDWLKNVLASGSATLVTEGRTYEVDRPEIVRIADVVSALPAEELGKLRLFRVEQALQVRRAEANRELSHPQVRRVG